MKSDSSTSELALKSIGGQSSTSAGNDSLPKDCDAQDVLLYMQVYAGYGEDPRFVEEISAYRWTWMAGRGCKIRLMQPFVPEIRGSSATLEEMAELLALGNEPIFAKYDKMEFKGDVSDDGGPTLYGNSRGSFRCLAGCVNVPWPDDLKPIVDRIHALRDKTMPQLSKIEGGLGLSVISQGSAKFDLLKPLEIDASWYQDIDLGLDLGDLVLKSSKLPFRITDGAAAKKIHDGYTKFRDALKNKPAAARFPENIMLIERAEMKFVVGMSQLAEAEFDSLLVEKR